MPPPPADPPLDPAPRETTGPLDRLVELVASRRVAVLAGAGCSTESGIPDYRGDGAPRRRAPVQYRAFVSDAAVRARYWARSAVGYERVAAAAPNPAHLALAELERLGVATGVVTQNVDGLHHRAGSRRVVELHGSLARVRCLACAALEPRAGFQERLVGANPGFRAEPAAFAPDGDAHLPDDAVAAFAVPGCRVCHGVLKPDVVFFGENVPRARVDEAWAVIAEADVLLVVGSSLAVFSGFRFVLRSAREGRPVAIVTVGETRGDPHATVKVEGRLGALLPELVRRVGAARA